jgi:hypothetical protein
MRKVINAVIIAVLTFELSACLFDEAGEEWGRELSTIDSERVVDVEEPIEPGNQADGCQGEATTSEAASCDAGGWKRTSSCCYVGSPVPRGIWRLGTRLKCCGQCLSAAMSPDL